jgi:hypothetical protein
VAFALKYIFLNDTAPYERYYRSDSDPFSSDTHRMCNRYVPARFKILLLPWNEARMQRESVSVDNELHCLNGEKYVRKACA